MYTCHLINQIPTTALAMENMTPIYFTTTISFFHCSTLETKSRTRTHLYPALTDISGHIWEMSPLFLTFPWMSCTPSIGEQACVTGKEGRKGGANCRPGWHLILKLLFPLHSILGAGNEARWIYISKGPGLHFFLNCLCWLHVRMSLGHSTGQGAKIAASWICFPSFFWKGLVVFICCKQAGRAHKSGFVQRVLVSRRRAAWLEYLSFV